MTPTDALLKAIRVAGSEALLAARIGYTQAAISHARRRGAVSAEMAVNIEAVTGIKRAWLRPDLFGTKAKRKTWNAPRNFRSSVHVGNGGAKPSRR